MPPSLGPSAGCVESQDPQAPQSPRDTIGTAKERCLKLVKAHCAEARRLFHVIRLAASWPDMPLLSHHAALPAALTVTPATKPGALSRQCTGQCIAATTE